MPVKLFKAKPDRKVNFDKKLCGLLDEYKKVLITLVDNVGTNQLQNIRKGLRGDSILLRGKNTLIRRCIKVHAEKTGNQAYLSLLPLLVGNVGLIFTKGDFKEVIEEVAKHDVGTPARGLVIQSLYDGGSVFSPEVLDLTEDDLIEKFSACLSSMVTSLSLAISYPTLSAASDMFINAYKNVLAVAIATDYTFPQAEMVKEYLKDPSRFVVAAGIATLAVVAAPVATMEEKKEEPVEESNDVKFPN